MADSEGPRAEDRSRPYRELAASMNPICTDDPETLRAVRNEARDSLDKTIEAVEEKDDKALSTVRINLVIVSFTLTAVSSFPITLRLANWMSIFGFTSVLISTGLGIFTYSGTDYTPGINADYIQEVRHAEYSETEWLLWMTDRYESWVSSAMENDENEATALQWTHVTQALGILLLVLGLVLGIAEILGPASIVPKSAGNESVNRSALLFYLIRGKV